MQITSNLEIGLLIFLVNGYLDCNYTAYLMTTFLYIPWCWLTYLLWWLVLLGCWFDKQQTHVQDPSAAVGRGELPSFTLVPAGDMKGDLTCGLPGDSDVTGQSLQPGSALVPLT